ncbi:DUF5819 family protein [Pseudobacteriovorax antillogorgiicola]|uniref:Uncharacterized protein n=1 Tax=Pseudobacteriovorax antillogorgiicola TaxID=1513793 RepID=A0A1Y6BM16_9BACT|nr:DUF5819 family protein [Pseudobacteriovorax antillogorgiicola]TCS54684.1 hypothetical protein EDD56_106197 [Pseudobacteriovorax antillogorgiicola]SMF16557.1 hypothetical protein SAMN06296036_10646 [Pseudobacteriovorax antillogorgiicola]
MKIRRLLFAGLATLLIHHLLMTALFLGPSNLVKQALASHVDAYMNPLFVQNWHLFSPNPGIRSVNLWVRCRGAEDWSDWQDPFAKLRTLAQTNPMSGETKLLYVYRYIPQSLFRLIESVVEQSKEAKEEISFQEAFDQILATPDYKKAEDMVLSLCYPHDKNRHAKQFEAQFKILKIAPPKYSERDLHKPIGDVFSLESPIIYQDIEGES